MPCEHVNPPASNVGAAVRPSKDRRSASNLSGGDPLYKRMHTASARAEARARRSVGAAGGGSEDCAAGRLGSKRQYIGGEKTQSSYYPVDPEQKKTKTRHQKSVDFRREQYADGRQAGRIYAAAVERAIQDGATPDEIKALPGRGVSMCGWTQIADMESAVKRVPVQGTEGGDGGTRAFLTGTQPCGLRKLCPTCAAKKMRADRAWVNDALAQARKERLWPVMLTLTVRHSRLDDAGILIASIATAEQEMKRQDEWKRLMARSSGYCRVLEWTWSPKNGHHPHYHNVIFVKAATEKEAIAAVKRMKRVYLAELAKTGRDGTSRAAEKHSFQVQGASAIANYITKWGVAEEITGAQAKDEGGDTAWQLLRKARISDTEKKRHRASAVWWQIMLALKGRTELHKSTEMKALAERYRATQEVEEPAEPETVLSFGVRQKGDDPTPAFVAVRSRRLSVLEAAESEVSTDDARNAVLAAMHDGATDDEVMDDLEAGDDLMVIDDDDEMSGVFGFHTGHPTPPKDGGEKESDPNYLSEAINNPEISLTG